MFVNVWVNECVVTGELKSNYVYERAYEDNLIENLLKRVYVSMYVFTERGFESVSRWAYFDTCVDFFANMNENISLMTSKWICVCNCVLCITWEAYSLRSIETDYDKWSLNRVCLDL